MTFSGYLVEYTLIYMFGHNRSAYARAVDMEEGNLRRLVRSIATSKAGNRLVDQTVDLYIQAQVDMTHIFSDYQALASSNSRQKHVCAFDFFIARAKKKLEGYRSRAIDDEDSAAAYRSALEMLHNMEKAVCGKNEKNRPKCKFYHIMGQFIDMDERKLRTCPCRRFEDFVDSLCVSR